MEIKSAAKSDCGIKRENNEDSILTRSDLGLYIVCDGMGGHAGGELASKIAVEVIEECVSNALLDGELTESNASAIVSDAIQSASREIYNRAQLEPEYRGMGTTATVLIFFNNHAVLGHVGDSRCYLRRREKLHQLSNDHTLAAELVASGKSNSAEVKKMPFAHALTRAVGIQPSVVVDTLVFDLIDGDTLLLCTDGLIELCYDQEQLFDLIGQESISGLPEKLIKLANELDGSDNVSVIVLRAFDSTRDAAREQEVVLKIDTLKGLSFFKELELAELLQIVERVTVLPAAEGADLVREGEQGDSMLVILSGRVAVYHQGRQLNTLESGNHFGEMSLLRESPRSATVRAIEPSILLKLKKNDFQEIVSGNPRLGVKLLAALSRELCSRLDQANRKVVAG
ncbi:MAG: hypothetical protein D6719_11650 [Candidatus Dadabacteria bacterium]|nr:MAG: hypothetical protein D6719_11650 [Candidatus Dadabacteria bacterium]